jgi:O-antigen/teichoic acid export membrane protein
MGKDRTPEERERRRKARAAKSQAIKPEKHEHSHPGGTAAAIGTHLAKFSSFQGVSLLLTNLLHYASLIVVARFLGPGSLGSYALLFFLTGLVTQIIHLLSKPGTMMRTFGISDDDADDIEEDEEKADDGSSYRPTFTLGVGLAWTLILSAAIIAPVAIFQTQISSFLLHDSSQGPVVLFATITGAVWAIFKLAEMVIWFEGRALTFALIDAARPAFNITAIIVILSMGAGVKGAIIGQTIGTCTATIACVALIWRSFQKVFSLTELKEILKRGAIRIPIATSLWVVQNSDSFILSRFLDHKSIGLYNLASRTGFMVAFLPQGFRMALRPIRKTAMYEAFRREYGIAVAQGQLLAYFYLLTLTAILAMVLGGEILIAVGGSKFESVAPLVPLTAAAMSMPALFRTIAMSATYNNRRKIFVSSAIFVGCSYLAFCIGFLSFTNWGIYSPPAAVICAFMLPSALMFGLSQFGKTPIKFPYALMAEATLVATALAVSYHFAHPSGKFIQLPFIAAVMVLWLCLLFVLRIIPRHHWGPISHIVRSALGRHSALQFDRRKGLRAIGREGRDELHAAVLERIPDGTLVPEYVDDETDESTTAASWMVHPDAEGARLVRLLRTAGSKGGVPLAEESEVDAGVSLYLFSDQPVSVRLRRMRQLLSAGVDPHELRTLDDLRNDLAKADERIWRLAGNKGKGKKAGAGDRKKSGKGGRVAAKRA